MSTSAALSSTTLQTTNGHSPPRNVQTCVVADNRFFARRGTCQYLEMMSGVEVIGEAESGVEAIEIVRELRPDVLLMEADLPDMDSDEMVRRLRHRSSHFQPNGASGDGAPVPLRSNAPEHDALPAIIVLSDCDNDRQIERLINLKVAGYVDKRDSPVYLVEALQSVSDNGGGWYSPRVSRIIVGLRRREEILQDYHLTDREVEVLQFLAEGQSNSVIAEHLFVTEGTVKNHLTNIYEKLDVSSRAQAIVWTYDHGLI